MAEGFADTMALKLWAEDRAVVVGAAGKGVLHHLAGELEAAGIVYAAAVSRRRYAACRDKRGAT